ncbi:MAG: gamma carbonic anhydrase family protein [Firmicutes bacterium]|nr:gamma carbonic anhydrase family protein [Dethiobacter sp.]MBS3897202.1 gamma carbonic anhydrase family protein [Dethiobacter sp.]MCL4462448.1 gamma carbonic anhydrase family protein [Bacillota bacterium]MCL5993670.1 gamma carbonic anhydrase family protein [Bacillota bacterium]
MLIEYNGKKPQISEKAFLAADATLIGDCVVEEGASIWFGARLRGDFGKIVIGACSSIQDNAVIHVLPGGATIVEEHVTVAHGAVLHNCTIKRGSVVGMNAVVMDNAVVGEQAMIAAGSVVASGTEIPARHLAAGTPAVVKKELSGQALWWVEASSAAYVRLAASYLEQGIGQVRNR